MSYLLAVLSYKEKVFELVVLNEAVAVRVHEPKCCSHVGRHHRVVTPRESRDAPFYESRKFHGLDAPVPVRVDGLEQCFQAGRVAGYCDALPDAAVALLLRKLKEHFEFRELNEAVLVLSWDEGERVRHDVRTETR